MLVFAKQYNLGMSFIVHTLYYYCELVQWNPSITDTFRDQHFVRYSEVSPTQGLQVHFR